MTPGYIVFPSKREGPFPQSGVEDYLINTQIFSTNSIYFIIFFFFYIEILIYKLLLSSNY